jgi:ABC transport system ATP-binding/permease protein
MISYLQVEELTKSFGDLILFSDISFSVGEGQRVALIAQNGAGKTSLLNIITGKDTPDKGKVVFRNEISVGYLLQDSEFDPSKTILQQVFSSSDEVVQAIAAYEAAIKHEDKTGLQDAIEQMDALNAWDYDQKIEQILSRLKIENLDQPMAELSGGQKKRVALANVLINEPDFLILDEPTNHLDLEMIEWLEEYLFKSGCTLLMVTHDRYFLDRVCNEIVEIDNKQVYRYKGNYGYYLEKRDARLQMQQSNVEKAQNLMRKELDWVRRMPKARGTKPKYRIEAFYALKEEASKTHNDKQIDLNILPSRLGSKVLEIKKIYKSFGDLKIVDNFSYNFNRNEKIGLVGKNGTGKTTFLNLVDDNIKLDKGDIEVGETVVFGYYKQEGMQFKENQRVIDVVKEIAEVVTLSNGRVVPVSQFLNIFLFPPEMHFLPVTKLSGGERRRLYLIVVLMKNPNFLILDEPTNDLDIMTLNVLEEYLINFDGCVMIVSHDRYFMDKVVDHLFVFEGEGVITDFPGNYSIYRDTLELKKEVSDKAVKEDIKKEKAIIDRSKKLNYKEKQEFDGLSAKIAELEKEMKKIELLISSGGLDQTELIEKSNRIGEIMGIIDEKTMRWMELSEKAGL